MELAFRWFGKKYDSISLKQIKQVPGITSIVSTLYEKLPGDVWAEDEIHNLKSQIEEYGFSLSCIESVNIHDSIKVGSNDRDLYIENYIKTLENLGKQNIHIVCYNFMPVFDWTRSDLAKQRDDGSFVMSYNQAEIDNVKVDEMMNHMAQKSNNFQLAGWEPERMEHIKQLFYLYEGVNEQILFGNLCYFLNAIMDTCDKYDINMAIHPDDPAWPVFNLPRIIKNQEDIVKLLNAVDNVHNGITICTGSLGTNSNNDIPQIIKVSEGRIHFAHIRNIKHIKDGIFEEAAHWSKDGSLDMKAIVKALINSGFNGLIRPDHGRAIWGEISMPGYGLYDRAIGANYILGLWEGLN
ncbi:MAG: mannonate dehydratase [Sphaerochaeta sp.]